jgi:NTE family protein
MAGCFAVSAWAQDRGTKLMRIDADSLIENSSRYKIAPFKKPLRKKVGLALSGGGARGLSQVGVLKALEEKNIPVDCIAGTSMGAIVGGLFAAGYSAADLYEIIKTLEWNELTSFQNAARRQDLFLEQKRVRDRAALTLQFSGLKLIIPKSLSSAQNLTQTLDVLCMSSVYHAKNSAFKSLPIPFKAITTDLVSGKRIVLESGSLSESMRASAAVPLLFAPIEIGDWQLVDGGLLSNIPVDVARSSGAEYVVAVSTVSGLYQSPQEIDLPWKAADQVVGIMMQEPNKFQLSQASRVIAPKLDGCDATDFSNIDSLVTAGYIAGIAVADSIAAEIALPQQNDRDVRGYKKNIVGIETAPTAFQSRIARLVDTTAFVKQTLAALLTTDFFLDAYAELDTVEKSITYRLEKTPAFSAVAVKGATQLSDEVIKRVFTKELGNGYTNAVGTKKLEDVIRLYRKRGFCLAKLTRVEVARDTLFIEIDEGKLNAVDVRQSRGWTQKFVIERELAIDTATTLTVQRAESSMFGLYNTGIFNRVSMWLENSDDSLRRARAEMVVKLDERFFELLRIGFRFDDVYVGQALIDFRNENFLGTASELGVSVSAGQRNITAQTEFRANRLWNTYLTFYAKAFFEQRGLFLFDTKFSEPNVLPERVVTGEYRQRFFGASVAIGGQLYRDGTATLELTRQLMETTPISITVPTEQLWTTTLRARLTIDTRNAPIEATQGNYTNIYYDYSPTFLGNAIGFSKLGFTHEINATFGAGLTGRLKFNAGFADNLTPFNQQFSLGGIGASFSVPFYGLRFDELRGRQLLTAGGELEFLLPIQLVTPTSISLNYNVGNIWAFSSDVKFQDFLHGIGIELLLKTPIGAARTAAASAFKFGEFNRTTFLQLAPPVFYIAIGYEF